MPHRWLGPEALAEAREDLRDLAADASVAACRPPPEVTDDEQRHARWIVAGAVGVLVVGVILALGALFRIRRDVTVLGAWTWLPVGIVLVPLALWNRRRAARPAEVWLALVVDIESDQRGCHVTLERPDGRRRRFLLGEDVLGLRQVDVSGWIEGGPPAAPDSRADLEVGSIGWVDVHAARLRWFHTLVGVDAVRHTSSG